MLGNREPHKSTVMKFQLPTYYYLTNLWIGKCLQLYYYFFTSLEYVMLPMHGELSTKDHCSTKVAIGLWFCLVFAYLHNQRTCLYLYASHWKQMKCWILWLNYYLYYCLREVHESLLRCYVGSRNPMYLVLLFSCLLRLI